MNEEINLIRNVILTEFKELYCGYCSKTINKMVDMKIQATPEIILSTVYEKYKQSDKKYIDLLRVEQSKI